jgi:acetyltransferase-like isoleucine patch superfamily enzyme
MVTQMTSRLKKILTFVFWSIYSVRYGVKVSSSTVSIRVKLGRNCSIASGTEVYGEAILGDYLYISGPGSYVEDEEIDKFCSIARGVTNGVAGHDHSLVSSHDFLFDKAYRIVKDPPIETNKSRPVIGNDVWFGMGSYILRGVTIGDGVVIAANSVVTKDVAPYSIVAGSPARHVKYRFSESVINDLLEIKWWDWSREKLKNEVDMFYTVERFVAKNRNA